MRTLVINLTRFGDLLQTQPVLSGFKAEGHEVGLVCLENFAGSSVLLNDVDHLFTLPGARLLAGLNKDWRHGLRDFWEWGKGGTDIFDPELVVNLTSNVSARLLAGFAGAGEQRGFCIDEHGFGVHTNPWAAFLMASSRQRGASPFNLVDLFIKVSELPPGRRELELKTPDKSWREQAIELIKSKAPDDARGFVALQLGASNDIRRWPVACFAELADSLWRERGLCAVLLGSDDETGLGMRFEDVSDGPFVNLIGKTSLEMLAATLTHMELLVTNDTGTMHLAAGLGLPVAAIFLATAQAWDTGPFRSGCLCLEPDMDCHPCGFSESCPDGNVCRKLITPHVVRKYIERRLDSGSWKPVDSEGTRAWVSKVEAGSFMDLESLTGHETTDRVIWIRMQRHVYRQFLDRGEIEIQPWNGPPLSTDFASALLRELEDSQRILFLMLEQVRLLSKSPSTRIRNKFLSNWQRLTSRWADNNKLTVLGDLWREQSQNVAEDISALEMLITRYMSLTTALGASLSKGGMVIE